MAQLLAESIPPTTRAWAVWWLCLVAVGLLGLIVLLWIIGRRRIWRHLDSTRKPPAPLIDPWVESARRLNEREEGEG